MEKARPTCANCGLNHEVECGEALDLSTGERTQLVMLVPKEEDCKQSTTRVQTEDKKKLEIHHVAEAINYHAFDRKLFG